MSTVLSPSSPRSFSCAEGSGKASGRSLGCEMLVGGWRGFISSYSSQRTASVVNGPCVGPGGERGLGGGVRGGWVPGRSGQGRCPRGYGWAATSEEAEGWLVVPETPFFRCYVGARPQIARLRPKQNKIARQNAVGAPCVPLGERYLQFRRVPRVSEEGRLFA